MAPVVVIGGGAAGLFYALQVIRRGWDVTVLEKNLRRKPCCGGLISQRALTLLGEPAKESVLNRIDGMMFVGKEGEYEVYKKGFAWVLDREKFETLLREEIVELGGRITEAEALDISHGKVFCREKKGSGRIFSGKVFVGADGVPSKVREILGLKQPALLSLYQERVKGRFREDVVQVWLVGERFFGWVIPENSEVARIGGENKYVVEKIRANVGGKVIDFCAKPIPWDRPEKQIVFGNVVLAGNAAGMVKATSGGGLYFVGKAGKNFASVLHSFLQGAGDLSEHQKFYETEILPVLKTHWKLGRRAFSMRKEKLEKLIAKAYEKGLLQEIMLKIDYDEPRGVKGLLLKKGAFWLLKYVV